MSLFNLRVSAARPVRRTFISIALLWLAGVGLRLTILAVPPLIPLIHDDLHMSETEVGILSGLPPVLFALAAVPGSLLIARFGALPTLIVGLFTTGLGSVLRGLVPDIWSLYAATMLTALGVAVMQPSLPPLVRAWLPRRIGFGTAIYTNGLLVGEILPVALTLPLFLPLVGGSWRFGFAVWGGACLIIALVILALAPPPPKDETPNAPRRWWPDWRSGVVWRLSLVLGSANAMYFAANAFIPDFLHQTGYAAWISDALSALNIGQLPASLLLLAYANRLLGRVWPYIACGALGLAATSGIMLGDGMVIVIASGVLGFATAAILILILALPPLLSPAEDVHRITAGMFTVSYSFAVIVPVISGLTWDLTAVPAAAFFPVGACAFLLMALAPTLRRPHRDASGR